MTSERKGTAELSFEEKRAMLAKMLQKKAEEPRVYPLSLAQQRLWILDRMEPGNNRSNISRTFSLSGPLQHEALEKAFQQVVDRHESLRTTFREKEGQPQQVVSPHFAFRLAMADVQHLPKAERGAAVRQLAAEEAKRPFDLEKGPLLRACSVRVGATEQVLVLTIHHIITDGWSMGVLMRELSEAYNAQVAGRQVAFAKLPIQYGDYARWQQNEWQGESLAKQLIYWKKQLDGAQTVLDLPTDRPRPSVKSYQGAMYAFDYPKALADRLKAVAREEQVTFFMLLLAAFQTLLFRYSGQEDLLLGTPIAGRNRPETEGLIGFFVNTLVLRGQLAEELTFAELLQRTRTTVLEAFAHQDVSFEKLVEEIEPERTQSHTPLVQAMFSLQNMPAVDLYLQDVQLQAMDVVDRGVSNFDLTLELRDGEQGLQGWMQYDTDLFAEATVARMMRHFQTLLEAVSADRGLRMGELPLLTAEEKLALSAMGKGAVTEYPRERSIHQVFEEQAAETPDAIAVICGERVLTYGELNRRANRVAHYLKGLDLGEQRLVGLLTERSPEMIVAMLGILKAGAGYLPLDPMYPQERLALMLEDAQVVVLLTEGALAERLPDEAQQVRVVRLDAEGDRIEQCSDHNVGADVTAEDLAYVIYTSGSTGRPKGVCVPHRGVVRLVKGTDYVEFSSEDVFLQFAPVSFDAATFEIWGSLLNGARLVLFPTSKASLEELGQVIAQHQVTTLWLTAGLFHQMVEGHLDSLKPVRQLLAGGDALSVAHVKRALEALADTTLINGYGPTENTTFSTFYAMTDPSQVGTNVLIGRPIANTDVYVLDRQGQPVPIGVPGELYLGGDGLAVGYLQRPELTEEKFVWRAGEKLYRTGDLVRFLPDGNLEFLGRIDNQVKIRGYRIELGEIENRLGSHSSVKETTVRVWEPVAGDKRLVAYVVTHQAGEINASELRAFLKESLPDFMVPSLFLFLPELPLTRNGKVDARALPTPDLSAMESEEDYVAPRTPMEELVAGIFAQLLGVERIGIHESFFERGGHSLLATQVISRLRQVLQVEVPLRSMFDTQTVSGLTLRIEELRRSEGDMAEQSPLLPVARDRNLPLSFAQNRLWFLDQLEPGHPVYNIPVALRLSGSLNQEALERALSEIVRRHEALRTTFAQERGQPYQVTTQEQEIFLTTYSLETSSLEQWLLAESRHSFALQKGPLFKPSLLRLSEHEHILILNMHHIVSDGWSVGVLAKELSALYEAFSKGAPSPLQELSIQYADFAVWQREWLPCNVLEKQMTYWKQQLGGELPLLTLPSDRPRPFVQTYNGDVYRVQLSSEQTRALRSFCRREGTTLYMLMLAVYQTLLHRYTGLDDILVGSPVAGRNRAEIEGLIGFFVNTLVLRTDLSGDPTFRELLNRVREVTLQAFDHQDVPFEHLVEELVPERHASISPLFQVMFVLQNAATELWKLRGLDVQPLQAHHQTAKFDLTLTIVEREETLGVHVEYNTDLFDRQAIMRLCDHFQLLMTGILADPKCPISHLPMLTEAEQQQLLVEWNDTVTAYPRDCSIHRLFEAQAAQTPDAIATVFGDQSLTYDELNRKANQMAHALRKLGVSSGMRVGLFLERSPDLLIALLGILKAGAAYLPLDPSYPAERLAFMLEAAQASVLLTHAHLASHLPPHQAQVVRLDADWEQIASESEENLGETTTAEQLAYVIFTSGSTGRPKGVCVPHRAVVRLVKETNYVGFSSEDVFLQFAPVSFDAATFEIWGSLLNGARLVLFPTSKASLEELGQVIAQHQVTTLWLTAGLFHQMVEGHLDSLKPVRQLLAGGDALSVPHVKRALEALADTTLINGYGPTENTTFSVCYRMTDPAQVGTSVYIGRPISNTELYVLDRHLQLVPVGVPGELFVGGDGLALGYLNRPDLTEAAFIPHPFRKEPGANLYRTGDLVRYLPDGNVEFLGRIDHQVKIRGYRIEPGEIENHLHAHEAVRECVVIVWEPTAGDKRLVAYVVADEREAMSAAEMRTYLQTKVPDFMVPSAFVFLAELPLNRNGKVDRRALPTPGREDVSAHEEYVPPRTPLEQRLAETWQEALRVERVGVFDHFFEMGGHSMLAIQVLANVRQLLGVGLPMHRLFEAPRIAELAVILEDVMRAAGGSQELDLRRRGLRVSPLSFDQEELWRVEQMEPGHAVYSVNSYLAMKGFLDVEALERSLQAVVKRQEMLRARFDVHEGEPVMVVEPEWTVELPLTDLSGAGLSEVERAEMARNLRVAFGQQPFDLMVEPPWRVELLRLGAEQHQLLVNMHHLITDGWSNEVFRRELAFFYNAFVNGEELLTAVLAELPIQYGDFVYGQREWLQGERLGELLQYWERQLAGAPSALELPTDFPRPAVRSYRGAKFPLRLAEELVERLEAFCQQEDVTMNMVLLAAFQLLLLRFSGQEDLVVGTPIVNRERTELADLIGYLISVLVMRTDWQGNPSVREALGRVKETAIGAYAHKDLPIELLMRHLETEVDLSRNALYQVMFVYFASVEGESTPFAGLEVQGELVDSGTSEFELMLVFGKKGRGIEGRLEYSTDLFALETVQGLAVQYVQVLEEMVRAPEQRVWDVELAERFGLLLK